MHYNSVHSSYKAPDNLLAATGIDVTIAIVGFHDNLCILIFGHIIIQMVIIKNPLFLLTNQ